MRAVIRILKEKEILLFIRHIAVIWEMAQLLFLKAALVIWKKLVKKQ
jgi:hypothetical protein